MRHMAKEKKLKEADIINLENLVAVVNVIGQGSRTIQDVVSPWETNKLKRFPKTQLQQHRKLTQIELKAKAHFNNGMRVLLPTGSNPSA